MIETLGDYRMLDRLGASRLGDVYRARDTKHGRTVAVTVVSPSIAGDRERRARLVQDARAVEACSHPSVAALFEVGEVEGQLYLPFEFASGDPLDMLSAGTPLNPRRALDIVSQLADGLADAHARGLVHGDLRPSLVIVTPKGHAKMYNVGLSAWLGEPPGPYTAPEQAAGKPPSEAGDVYSLGVMLHELLTGRVPPAAGLAGGIPPVVEPILGRALAREPGGRYESIVTMAADVRAASAALDPRNRTAQPAAPAPVKTKTTAKPLTRTAARTTTKSGQGSGLMIGLLALAVLAVLIWYLS
jgi:serine/threonine-protein kinase